MHMINQAYVLTEWLNGRLGERVTNWLTVRMYGWLADSVTEEQTKWVIKIIGYCNDWVGDWWRE